MFLQDVCVVRESAIFHCRVCEVLLCHCTGVIMRIMCCVVAEFLIGSITVRGLSILGVMISVCAVGCTGSAEVC